ncbi:hypothetical protein Abu_1666 [Aliarcobacter butzleri RM4018]|uniref:Lipoprotein n=1 Tax=Aliarcobacter butzleri (strain RM4018) TaxID=367737 RepID=A8EVE0_ALIB4|nr:hypothetical protein [Aliarcobacter butzleri]ABV67913.1 hypothetical protein Abu_1666 [Aliarcobacter butzleri RM4018]GGT78437.1 hypothetical protein GCM10007985_13490 [Aliarcobacter butzleri]SNV31130.1 Uncharacterised protein [Aliarcobacter butzleri]
MTKLVLISCFFVLAFSGCATKTQTEYIYKDVYVPVKCNAVIPTKPKSDGSFEADKQKMIYFLKVESLLKECVGAK